MANNIDLGRRVFTNTYITGSGRQNYLRIDHLEDPLFTSFTFDIDYTTSPLFYTINYSDYGYPNAEGIGKKIEDALEYMHYNNLSLDEGYDILPLLSASILDGNKLGFGLQQNVYMDTPLYGATEYIYMVDKRNGGANQNDARYDSNRFAESGGNPNTLNSYKLGDSVKEIVNESDKEWAERNKNINDKQIEECENMLSGSSDPKDPNYNPILGEHENNKSILDAATDEVNGTKAFVYDDPNPYSEADLKNKLDECNKTLKEFEQFKREVVEWINGELNKYKSRADAIYSGNPCYKLLYTQYNFEENNHYTGKTLADIFIKSYGQNFINDYLLGDNIDSSYYYNIKKLYVDFYTNFVVGTDIDTKADNLKYGGVPTFGYIYNQKVIDKFRDKFTYFEFGDNIDIGEIKIFHDSGKYEDTNRKWVNFYRNKILNHLNKSSHVTKCNDSAYLYAADVKFKFLMGSYCDFDTAFSQNFKSEVIKKCEEDAGKYEAALSDIRYDLYGADENGNVCDIYNATPDSKYGKYLAAKDQYENDEYSKTADAMAMAQSGSHEAGRMLNTYETDQNYMNNVNNGAIQKGEQPTGLNKTESIVASQTVLDMLGFIKGMKNMTTKYPYIIQNVTGLDTAYNKHYGIKDSYLGSGDDKIVLTCLESLDLRVSSMFNRYFNAVYDRQYRRERVPVNLRRFNCSIYVHDVRNFIAKSRIDENGDYKMTYNRLLELTDMYYSVIEFRFYDCEIVPEETGNIFNDVSNESPSEMKKTNFTFTYGNCVVNFVPNSEVASHNG
jgi:hypothetical protein